jgi:Zn-dependent peptidase ImmA (M78 family)
VECNKLVTFKGETRTIAEWARDYNISWQTLYYRLESGMSISVALTKPTKIVVTYNDEAKSVPEWAAYFSIKRGVLYKRLQRHSIDEVFSDLVLLRSYNENLRPYN